MVTREVRAHVSDHAKDPRRRKCVRCGAHVTRGDDGIVTDDRGSTACPVFDREMPPPDSISPDLIVKAGHRRALRQALRHLRCPNCNRSGSLTLVQPRSRTTDCWSCGAAYRAEVEFDAHMHLPPRRGYRWRAVVLELEPSTTVSDWT